MSPTGTAAPQPGVLLINLGTPDAPRTPEVRRYLQEFLSDPRVIDIPWLPRMLLLHLVILPWRPARSAEAYRKIWTAAGSPLLVHGEALVQAVARSLGPGIPVELAMRYGRPSIRLGLCRLAERRVDRVVVFPLYPQNAASSTGSTLEKVYREAGRYWDPPLLLPVPPFFGDPRYARAVAEVARPVLRGAAADHILMSYHGLPERQIQRSGPGYCLTREECCDSLGTANRGCYRAQCHDTTRRLVRELGLDPAQVTTTFQSRLGRTPWIRPYTDVVLAGLPARGVKRVVVFSPSFVADCLETLEEIALRGHETFLRAGGEALTLVPSLNTTPAWVDLVTERIRETLK
jgi:ferrochelatase